MPPKKTPPPSSPVTLPVTGTQNPRQDILDLLRALTHHALEQGQFAIALKALELWGKEMGLFCGRAVPGGSTLKPLAQMSDEELDTLLSELT
ncbi:MAG: hypothetical protein LCH26_07270 [Proteobacteria bacterium]|nr:hypothetical protein [Pseudomonadota bacterium]